MAKRSWKEVTLAERGPGTPRKRDQTSLSTSRDLLSLSGEAIFMTLGQLQRKQMQTDRLPLQNLEIPNSGATSQRQIHHFPFQWCNSRITSSQARVNLLITPEPLDGEKKPFATNQQVLYYCILVGQMSCVTRNEASSP